jgi:amidohydrolase
MSERIEAAKQRARDAIGAASEELVRISKEIHAHPELAYEERRAYAELVPFVREHGFAVQEHAYGMETAFRGEWGHGPVTIAICAEYDALPEIGHACGHNLIATTGIGAAVGLKAALEPGDARVVILGTPAEEGNGGKVKMVQRGCFDDIDAAIMAHPAPVDILDAPHLGVAHVDVEYRGKAVHASVFPEQGINALDALVLAYTSIGLLRHHIRKDARLHGIIRHGGDAPNVVPEYTKGSFYVRALKPWYLEQLKERVKACFEAAALATGCSVTMDWHPDEEYAPMRHNGTLVEAYRRNGEALGKQWFEMKELAAGSTDMGNVSQVVPAIHPTFGVGTPAFTHSPEFTAAAVTDAAHAAMLQTAQALAMTGVDIALEAGLIEEIKREFASRGRKQ